ncbi:unnamed protein product [Urochloa humidicola]
MLATRVEVAAARTSSSAKSTSPRTRGSDGLEETASVPGLPAKSAAPVKRVRRLGEPLAGYNHRLLTHGLLVPPHILRQHRL